MYGPSASRITTSVDKDGRTQLGPDGTSFGLWRRFVDCPSAVCGDHMMVLDSDALLAPSWRTPLFEDYGHDLHM